MQDIALLPLAHQAFGVVLFFLGEFALSREHMEQGIRLYDPQRHNPQVSRTPYDPGVTCLSYIARILWFFGYPDQALKKIQEARTLAQELSHSFSLSFALGCSVVIHQCRRDGQATQKQAEEALTLASEQQFAFWVPSATFHGGWALVEQGQTEEGMIEVRKGGQPGKTEPKRERWNAPHSLLVWLRRVNE